MAKDGTSPKTKRAAKHPKKGSVRFHNPKHKSTLENTGLLDDLAGNTWRQLRSANIADANLAKARQHLCNEVGKRIAAIAKDEQWDIKTRQLICSYVKSLALGDGSKPAELSASCAKRVEGLFAQLCSHIIVGDSTIPAQRQDWYQPTLERLRMKKRPTPRSIPRKRALQPTG